MLYVIGRALSVICLLAINISVNLLWFKVSAILGIAVLLAILFVVYKERDRKNSELSRSKSL